jgi:hypothetical protein
MESKTTVARAAAAESQPPLHQHHTGSAASGRGAPPAVNPAHFIKHPPSYCPNCGEPLSAHSVGSGAHSQPPDDAAEGEESAAHEAAESPEFEAGEQEGMKELTGSPGFGSVKRAKGGTKLRGK